jgi:hypothetical protein
MAERKPDFEEEIHGRTCQAWRRRSFVQVLVLDGEDIVGDWEMPIAFRYDLRLAATVAQRQTGLAVRFEQKDGSFFGGDPGETWVATYVVPRSAVRDSMTETEAEEYDRFPTFRKKEK